MRHKLLTLVVAVAAIVSLVIVGCAKPAPTPAPTPAPEKVYQWRLQAFYPPPEDQLKVNLADFVERVDKATNGQVEITLYSGGQLVPSPQIFDSVASGIVDMGLTVPGYHVGFMPFGAVVEGLPMTWRDPNDLMECMWQRGLEDLVRDEYAKHGVYFLGWQDGGIMSVLSTKPLRTKADFQGTKIRAWGPWTKFFEKLGASPVETALSEVYEGLSMGTFDGAFTGLPAHYTLKFYEACEYGMEPALIYGDVHDITVNLKEWNALPDNLKEAITSASIDHTKWAESYFYDNYILTYRDKLEDEGVQWVELDSETQSWMQQNATEMFNEAAANDPVSTKAAKIITDYFREVGYIK